MTTTTEPPWDTRQAQAARLRGWAVAVLVPVALIGAVLSFSSLYRAAVPIFGPELALGFPLLVDASILGASLAYVAGAKVGQGRSGWRWTAHAGVAGTLALNAMTAHSPGAIPWHVTAPAVWSVLVELTAREVLGRWRATHQRAAGRIPVRLWVSAPVESARTWLRIARRLDGEQTAARLDVGVHAAAVEALKVALPRRGGRRVRRILRRQLRSGTLAPAAVLEILGWTGDHQAPGAVLRPAEALRAMLAITLTPHTTTTGPARTQARTHAESPAEGPARTVAESPARTDAEALIAVTLTPHTPAEGPARTRAEGPSRTQARTVAEGPESGVRERRTEEELAVLVRAAIVAGTLPAAPSGTAIQRLLGGGKEPAVRVAARLAARVSSADPVAGADPAAGEGPDPAGGLVVRLVPQMAEAAS